MTWKLCYFRAIKTKTGEWHRDLVRRRCRGRSVDVPATLFRRISLDLITHEPRKRSRTARSSPTSSPCSSSSIVRSTTSQISLESPSDADMDEPWAEEDFSSSCFKPSTNLSELSEIKSNDTDVSNQLSKSIEREALDQREI